MGIWGYPPLPFSAHRTYGPNLGSGPIQRTSVCNWGLQRLVSHVGQNYHQGETLEKVLRVIRADGYSK